MQDIITTEIQVIISYLEVSLHGWYSRATVLAAVNINHSNMHNTSSLTQKRRRLRCNINVISQCSVNKKKKRRMSS